MMHFRQLLICALIFWQACFAIVLPNKTPKPIDLTQLGSLQGKLPSTGREFNFALCPYLDSDIFLACTDDAVSDHEFPCDNSDECLESDNPGESFEGAFYDFSTMQSSIIFTELIFSNDLSVGFAGSGYIKQCGETFIGNKSQSDYGKYSGIIGLSTMGEFFIEAFLQNKNMFALYFPQDASKDTPKLLFEQDNGLIDGHDPIFSVKSNQNWEINIKGMYVNGVLYDKSQKAIFDPNIDYIGLYYNTFLEVIDILAQKFSITCQEQICTCQQQLDINSLPVLLLSLEDESSIEIIPSFYFEKDNLIANTYNLKLMPLSANPKTKYTYVTKTYSQYVILGRPYMQKKYISFINSNSGQQIKIFHSYTPPVEVLGFKISWTKAIFFGIIGLCCVLGCCLRLFKRRKLEKQMGLLREEYGSMEYQGLG